MTRVHLLVAALAFVLACAVCVWFGMVDQPSAPERAREPAADAPVVAGDGGVSLASSRAHEDGGIELSSASAAPIVDQRRALAADLLPLLDAPQRIVVRRNGAPLAGAQVELWNACGETRFETCNADGVLELVPPVVARGPWFALAGGDGACTEALEPVALDPMALAIELVCVDTGHLAVVFERSDGARLGSWPGVHGVNLVGAGGSYRSFRGAQLTAPQIRCLVAAGLEPTVAAENADLVVVTWGEDEQGPVVGFFREPDTEWTRWTGRVRALTLGGEFDVVPVAVRPHVARGTVEVRFTGGAGVDVLRDFAFASVVLGARGGGQPQDDVTLVLLGAEVGAADVCLVFEVPSGSYDARLHLGLASRDQAPSEAVALDVRAGERALLEFELPLHGALRLDPASVQALGGDGSWLVVLQYDVSGGPTRALEARIADGRITAVPLGTNVVRVASPTRGVLVKSETARLLAREPELLRSFLLRAEIHHSIDVEAEHARRFHELLVDVRAGAAAAVEFVPDPPHEEQR